MFKYSILSGLHISLGLQVTSSPEFRILTTMWVLTAQCYAVNPSLSVQCRVNSTEGTEHLLVVVKWNETDFLNTEFLNTWKITGDNLRGHQIKVGSHSGSFRT